MIFSKFRNKSKSSSADLERLSPSQLNKALDKYSALIHVKRAGTLRHKINVCARWANKVADISNPKNCFRDLSMLGFNKDLKLPECNLGSYSDGIIRGYDDWMFYLHSARCDDLNIDRFKSDDALTLAGGRLFVMEPHMTTAMGVSGAETVDFLDVDDCPPIGLWIDYIQMSKIVNYAGHGQPYLSQSGYILSYIPAQFIDLVQRGIDVNAEECILWLDDHKHASAEIIRSWM